VFNEDSVDDVVEINTIEEKDPSIHTNLMTKTKVQKKRKKTSIVQTYFDEFLSKNPNDARI
jgi:phage terminase large subunit-like protein